MVMFESFARSSASAGKSSYKILVAWCQGRIYVANEYLTFARTILIVCQKLRISCKSYLEKKTKSVYLDEKHANLRVKHANS